MISAIAWLLAIARKSDSEKSKLKIVWQPIQKTFPYVARPRVMNGSEAAVYHELLKQLPQGFLVAPKMRIADFIHTENNDPVWLKQIWAKHVDLLITDRYSKPVLAIEVNGMYHSLPHMTKRDRFVHDALNAAGIPLETITVGTNFSQSIGELVSKRFEHQTTQPAK